MTIPWIAVGQYFADCECLFFSLIQFIILENLSVFDLALTGVKGLNSSKNSLLRPC